MEKYVLCFIVRFFILGVVLGVIDVIEFLEFNCFLKIVFCRVCLIVIFCLRVRFRKLNLN